VKDRDFLLLTNIADDLNEAFQIKKEVTEIKTPIGLKISTVNLIEAVGPNILYVDKETLKYPLLLRKWQKGDYFYPLGMGGSKKLSKYFKDEKVDVIAKERQWLLCSDNKIVWVVGKRADDRFKITEKTKDILKIVLN
jgi:tRNA(Ile)-lysidine synthase